MNEQDLIEFLKNNLQIITSKDYSNYSPYLKIELRIRDVLIDSDTIEISYLLDN